DVLLRFTEAAFRRPTNQSDVAPYLNLMRQSIQEGRTGREALKVAMKAILVSPDFLYLKERVRESGRIQGHELANRLSYFLWSSLPDEELFSLAKRGELVKPMVRREQARRMLADPKAETFLEGFGESWLRLDKLGSMPPDSTKFGDYYDLGYGELFRQETDEFLRYMMSENRPIEEFLRSDYAFVNETLAGHYGIQGVHGVHFRKVRLEPEHKRGGLLGQASIQTLTANGVDTSPVVRGIWVLESILGTPPAPPPPDVEPLDGDTRGARTIRDRLEKHRKVETCADCHAKIDPYGFPFEFYDAIGGYRDQYLRGRRWVPRNREIVRHPGAKVDGRGELGTGEVFHHLSGLQTVLLQRKDQFKYALVEKLMTYATGRKMTFRDHAALEAIAEKNANGFQSLILEVVGSRTFSER
ncbi:MAG: DUF1592 domain-containing protein, partial [Verrucomicrobiota bacterium]